MSWFALTTRRAIAIVCAAAALSLLLRAAIPVSAAGNNPGDDALFVHMAANILDGQWLGDYDLRTLSKGIFYGVFIAGSSLLGLPLKIAEQFAYLAAAGAAAWLLRRVSASRALAVVAFVMLAFNPALWHPDLARVLRDGLYVSMSFAVFATAALLLFVRPASPIWRNAALLGFGILFATYWLTREESVWLYPALALLALGAGVLHVMEAHGDRVAMLKSAATSISLQGAIVVLGFILLAGGVATLNYRNYGVFLTNEIREGNFASAYGALMRIEPDRWQRYAFFPTEVLQQAYAVSPATAELKPVLTETAPEWHALNCTILTSAACPPGTGGSFFWQMRDAMAQIGYFRDGATAQAFEARLAGEINAACDSGRLHCLPARATMAPPFRGDYIAPTLASVWRSFEVLFGVGGQSIGSAPSRGSVEEIDAFRRLVGRVTPPAPASGEPSNRLVIGVMWFLSVAYYLLLRVLAAIALVGVGTAAIRVRALSHQNAAVLTVALAAAAAVAARCVLISYIDVTTWTAVYMLYLVEATPFLMLFAIAGSFLALRVLPLGASWALLRSIAARLQHLWRQPSDSRTGSA